MSELNMVKAGQYNTLKVVKTVSFGVYLDGGKAWGEILLPKKYAPRDAEPGDELKVFIYFDSEDDIIATTQRPRACVGQFAHLKMIANSPYGAFMDWGLDKDLLVPKPEQRRPMKEGQSYLTYLKLDSEGRVVGSTKIDRFLDRQAVDYKPGEEVSLVIAEETELGYKAIVNHQHWGLIHHDEVFKTLRYGKKETGYIKKIREDGKIDLALRRTGYEKVSDLAGNILRELNKNNGFLPLHDKSSPEEIKRVFGESKKAFKSAIGNLYKNGKIVIEKDGIRLAE